MLLDEAVAGHDGNVITAVSPAGAIQGWDCGVAPQRVFGECSQLATRSCKTGRCSLVQTKQLLESVKAKDWEILYSCCLSCHSAQLMLITRTLIHQPYRFLQLLLEGQGLICSFQHRISGTWYLGSGASPVSLAFKVSHRK